MDQLCWLVLSADCNLRIKWLWDRLQEHVDAVLRPLVFLCDVWSDSTAPWLKICVPKLTAKLINYQGHRQGNQWKCTEKYKSHPILLPLFSKVYSGNTSQFKEGFLSGLASSLLSSRVVAAIILQAFALEKSLRLVSSALKETRCFIALLKRRDMVAPMRTSVKKACFDL